MPDLPTTGQGGIGFKAIVNALINVVRSLNQIYTLLGTMFPSATSSLSTSATAGAGSALPATPEKYITVMVNGVAYKVPAYLP